MIWLLRVPLAVALAAAASLAPSAAQAPSGTVPAAAQSSAQSSARQAVRSAAPLAGITIAIDPGHQLGNHNFPRQINRLVPAGGFMKPCNTTGTATNGGYAEATLNFRVATVMAKRLRRFGARVVMTRSTNRQDRWGPCVNTRGAFPGKHGARLMVSLHGDGAPSYDHGFHVIAPVSRRPWTNRIAKPSLRLARALRWGMDTHAMARSNYIGSGTALSIRSDLGTLNMSKVPVAMVEMGNMRNAADARRMTSRKGQRQYAVALVSGIRRYLGR